MSANPLANKGLFVMRDTTRTLALLGALLLSSPLAAQTVEYVHTDALGSVVAITNSGGAVVERNQFEPYGDDLTGIKDGPGYTGHVSDAATGLSYMQQRYYDPQIGQFLSVDPVTPYSKPVAHYNRFRYANGNPYKFVDLDGRCAASRIAAACESRGMGAKTAIEAGWTRNKRTKTADQVIRTVERRLESREGGNRFKNVDAAANYFRNSFAKVGTFLQLEFGAVSEPGANNITNISRSMSPGDFRGGVGSRVITGPVPIGGADFHTHPDINHPAPSFSGDDLSSAMAGDGDASYVFYGYSTYAGKKLDVQAARQNGASAASSDIHKYISDVP
jgi:RHS repeat-associated protein